MVDSIQTSSTDETSWCWRDTQTKLTWVFGMRWLPALGASGQRHLYRSLRQQGLSWAVTHGRALSLVGVQAQGDNTKMQRQAASAAVAFANARPQGVHALCLEVTGVGVWLVACSQGCVLSETDRWFETLDQARLVLQTLRERHAAMTDESTVWAPANPDSGGTDVPTFLRSKATRSCQFRKLPSGQSTWPLILAFGCLGLAGLLVVNRLWIVPLDTDQATSEVVVPTVPSTLKIEAHQGVHLNALLQAWQTLPVDPSGWLLNGVRCSVADQWVRCSAEYERQRQDADNTGLISHMPEKWHFVPQALERATYERRLPLPLNGVSHATLPSHGQGLTVLQQLSNKLVSVSVGPARAGQVNEHVVRALSFRLALRQSGVLEKLRLPIRWQQVDLSVVHGAQVDERQGYLMVSLQGDWVTPVDLQKPHESQMELSSEVASEFDNTPMDEFDEGIDEGIDETN